MEIKKSSRHSKITGDFAEGLVLYWLSKYGYECARVDHVGIDLIARNPKNNERLGISVKSRSRYDGTEGESVLLPADGFDKADRACQTFGLIPYYAVVIDGGGKIRCYMTTLAHLREVAGGTPEGNRYWKMGGKRVELYRNDPLIEIFEMEVTACSWRDRQPEIAIEDTED